MNFPTVRKNLDIEETRIRHAVGDCGICVCKVSCILFRTFLDLSDRELGALGNLRGGIISKSDAIVTVMLIAIKDQGSLCENLFLCRRLIRGLSLICTGSFCVVSDSLSCFSLLFGPGRFFSLSRFFSEIRICFALF